MMEIAGELPASFAWTDLLVFQANSNNMNGTISESFGNSTSLSYLILYDNSFSGSLPSKLKNSYFCITMIVKSTYITVAEQLGAIYIFFSFYLCMILIAYLLLQLRWSNALH